MVGVWSSLVVFGTCFSFCSEYCVHFCFEVGESVYFFATAGVLSGMPDISVGCRVPFRCV